MIELCSWIAVGTQLLLAFSFILLIALIPFFLIFNIGSTDFLTCRRLTYELPTCQHQIWRLFGLYYQSEEWQLQSATVIEDGVDTTSYSLVLTTSKKQVKKEVKLSYYDGDREKVDRDFNQVNRFLESASPEKFSLRLQYSIFLNIFLLLVAALFFLSISVPFGYALSLGLTAILRYVNKKSFR